jgi:hypothetical protein
MAERDPQRGSLARDKLELYEAWWALLARVFSFFFGAGIMFWQTAIASADRPWLIAAATGMMGLPVANVIGKMLSAAAAATKPEGDKENP